LGVIFFTDVFKTGMPGSPQTTTRTPTTPTVSREAQLVKEMNDAAGSNGFAASFMENDLRKWQIADGYRLERFTLESSGPAFARLSSSVPLDKSSVTWPALGLSAGLPSTFIAAANGKRIQIGVVARASRANASGEVSVLFATQQAGNSGWRSFPLDGNFQLFKFVYDIPPVDGGYTANPIIVVNSDANGSGKSVELLGIYAKIVQ
jgi:hypothetical protein